MNTKEKITYGIVEETYMAAGQARTAYGIAAFDSSSGQQTEAVLAAVHDICSDREALVALIDRCNCAGLLPEHLNDAVDDFMER